MILFFPLQRAAVLRKRFDIHIAGQNAPAPLESFEELISRLGFSTIIGQLQIMVIMEPFQVAKLTSFFCNRYGCDSYLVGNLSKLGFQEPTPIQRQAMPILLSVSEFELCLDLILLPEKLS